MIEALIAGERDPHCSPGWPKAAPGPVLPPGRGSPDGRFNDHHARLARMLLDQSTTSPGRIAEVTALLDDAIAALAASPAGGPHRRRRHRRGDPAAPAGGHRGRTDLCRPGGGPDIARAVIGEIGLDMAVFGTAPRLCSWAKISPRAPCNQAAKPAKPPPAKATRT